VSFREPKGRDFGKKPPDTRVGDQGFSRTNQEGAWPPPRWLGFLGPVFRGFWFSNKKVPQRAGGRAIDSPRVGAWGFFLTGGTIRIIGQSPWGRRWHPCSPRPTIGGWDFERFRFGQKNGQVLG